jgi:hypothetical protein
MIDYQEEQYLKLISNDIFDSYTLPDYKLRKIANFIGDVLPKYQWDLRTELPASYTKHSVYHVYDSNQNYLYSNYLRNNIFGDNELDRQQLSKIKHGDYVILLFDNQQILLWLAPKLSGLNLLTEVENIKTDINNNSILNVKKLVTLQINLDNLVMDETRPFVIYYLEAPRRSGVTLEFIKANSVAESLDYLIGMYSIKDIGFLVAPKRSGYLVIEYTTPEGFKNYLQLTPEQSSYTALTNYGVINYVDIYS